MNERDRRLIEYARELERRLREQGIDPADHRDEDVEAILERERSWLGDDWAGE
jgi:hypothetical protein